MGSDIHIYVQYQQFNRWDETSDPHCYWSTLIDDCNPGRCYGLFAKLAGVRNYHEVSFPPLKGWPADSRLAHPSEDLDFHSITHFTAEEYLAIVGPMDNAWGSLSALISHLNSIYPVRVLIGFDS